jgi:hypothetical protein
VRVEASFWNPLFVEDAAQPVMKAEMDAYFGHVAFGGGSFEDRLLSHVGFANEDTALLYDLNPPGFVLEVFDAISRPQETDPLGGAIDGVVDVVLDRSGELKEISSPYEPMSEIAVNPRARRFYAEKWVSSAMRRLPNSSDACTVDELDMRLASGGYSILQILADITQMDSFRLRRPLPAQ